MVRGQPAAATTQTQQPQQQQYQQPQQPPSSPIEEKFSTAHPVRFPTPTAFAAASSPRISANSTVTATTTTTLSTAAPEYEYASGELERCDDHLKCPVCFRPMVSPMMHTACGNMFCSRPTVGNTSTCVVAGAPCPMCTVVVESLSPVPRAITQPLDELKVVCPACKTSVARGTYERHMLRCSAPCPHGCGEKLSSDNISAHEKTCPNLKATCSAADINCPWHGPRLELPKHEEECCFVKMKPIIQKLQNQITQLQARIDALEEAGPKKPIMPKAVVAVKCASHALECRALYDFKAGQEGDLSFSSGDIITVTRKNGDWWTGSIGGRQGVFPSNYVELI